NTSISGSSGSTTTIELEPALDYFVIRNLSIGGSIEFNYVSAGTTHSTRFGVGPRVGYNFTLSDLISVWPRAGLSIGTKSSTTDPAPGAPAGTPSISSSGTNVQLNLYVPLMFHPAPHFFAGLGPFLDVDLSGDAKATTFGAKMTIGGWVL
ncbi:MAG: hypothetical protein M3O46_20770, partial [Myxococcota bacterium]|nr:hypothetical protein [Myxococcota bacterium]